MYNGCLCKEILEAEFGHRHERIVVHLMGCPESEEAKEYQALSWWKKLFRTNPRRYYDMHLSVFRP